MRPYTNRLSPPLTIAIRDPLLIVISHTFPSTNTLCFSLLIERYLALAKKLSSVDNRGQTDRQPVVAYLSGKVTVGLASHWPCVTDSTSYIQAWHFFTHFISTLDICVLRTVTLRAPIRARTRMDTRACALIKLRATTPFTLYAPTRADPCVVRTALYCTIVLNCYVDVDALQEPGNGNCVVSRSNRQHDRSVHGDSGTSINTHCN